MNGFFADTLKNCAHWFLYIFIEPNAPLNKTIMQKRSNQIAWLKRLDAINMTYTYAQLYDIVREGIIKRYNKTPGELLTILYNTTSKSSIKGVGALIDDETAKGVDVLKNLGMQTTTPTGETKVENFWDGLNSVRDFIKEIMDLLGIERDTDVKPTYKEWIKPDTGSGDSLAAIGDYLPWIMGGTIVWFLMSSPNTGKNKIKKK